MSTTTRIENKTKRKTQSISELNIELNCNNYTVITCDSPIRINFYDTHVIYLQSFSGTGRFKRFVLCFLDIQKQICLRALREIIRTKKQRDCRQLC